MSVEQLEAALGRPFKTPGLADRVLTHSSLLNELLKRGPPSNQTLAHLGDAVVELVVRAELFKRFNDDGATKKQLTDTKNTVVKNKDLAQLARNKRFPPPTAGGALSLPGANDRAMAELFEAAIGAVFMDTGYDFQRTREIVLRLVTIPDKLEP